MVTLKTQNSGAANETTARPDLEGTGPVFPVGNGRTVIEAIAATGKAHDKREAIYRATGYHPWQIIENDIMNAQKFDFWFAKLPADLTDVNLGPLYLLAADASHLNALRKRERNWEPNPDNLGDEYNGPTGEDARPLPENAVKWARAVAAKEEAHRARFEADVRLMTGGGVPERLKEAALALVELSLKPLLSTRGDFNEWDDCSSAEDIIATDAAVRLVLQALCEIDERRLDVARESLVYLRADATRIANVQGVL